MVHLVKQERSSREDRRTYTVEAVSKACKILQAFRHESETLRLRDLVARCHLNKTTVFRMLCTLVDAGMIEPFGSDRYRSRVKLVSRQKFRLGFANSAHNSFFTEDVAQSLRQSAVAEGFDLLEFSNKCSAKIALQNAELMIKSRVDLAIEYQYHQEIAQTISAMFQEAGIPLVAITVPHPGAVFYGPNGYEVGRTAGKTLGLWAKQHWNSVVDHALLLEVSMGGPVLHSRLAGVVVGLHEVLEGFTDSQIIHLDGRGEFSHSLEAARQYLRHSRARHLLISSPFDGSALGALRAFEEAGRSSDCIAVGQGGTLDARKELRRPHTRMIGTVALFPETYGPGLIRVAVDILKYHQPPSAILVKHSLLTPQNVDQYYPNDLLLETGDVETVLLRSP
jgi:ribose transport system substrate-binding protein